jgi:hypothetical protein
MPEEYDYIAVFSSIFVQLIWSSLTPNLNPYIIDSAANFPFLSQR